MKVFKGPDGNYFYGLKERDQYEKVWREVAEPLEECLGLELMGFDPDYLFYCPMKKVSINLPTWFVELLGEVLIYKENREESTLEKDARPGWIWDKEKEIWIGFEDIPTQKELLKNSSWGQMLFKDENWEEITIKHD